MDHPLRQPLRPLRERVGVRQVEVAGEVDEQERTRRTRAGSRVVRGTRQRRVETANATGSRIASTSASDTVPATFQCTFSNVTQKTLARKRKLVARLTRCAPAAARAPATRERRETFSRHSSESSVRLQRPVAPARVQVAQRARDPVDVVGRDDHAGARLADQLRRRAVGRHDREDRPLGGEVLEDLAAEHALAAAAGLRDQEQQRPPSRAAARASVRRGAYGISSSRSPSPCASAHSRSVERKSPRKRATTSSRPDCCNAVRNGRGSRLPKNEPACVIRKRLARRVLDAREVVEVGAVRDRHDRARAGCARASPRRSPRRRATIAFAWRATSPATACSPCSLARTSSRSASPVRMRDDASRAGRRPTARPSRA